MQIKSITLRLFLSECLVLVIFFTVMLFTFDYVVIEGLAKDRLLSFMNSLESDVRSEFIKTDNNFMSGLEIYVRSEVINTDKNTFKNILPMPYHFREGQFGDEAADLYGFAYYKQKQIWQSPSVHKGARAITLPDNLKVGETVFLRDDSLRYKRRYVLFKNVELENAEHEKSNYMLMVSEGDILASMQLNKLKEPLKQSVSILGLALLVVRFLVLRSGLKPLRRIAVDLKAIDEGKKELLNGRYPDELQGIVSNLNAFIAHERLRLERHRQYLADLAHSLKTPLAILRGCTENFSDNKDTVNEQIARMDEIVMYQLQRASVKANHTVIKQLNVCAVIEKIHASLSKVYLDKGIQFELILPESCSIYCEEGDLYEIIGNLMDNACKWCKHQVKVSIELNPRKDRRNYALLLHIEDDGAGIPVGQFNAILKRGIRADENIDGHGIGVSVVYEIIQTLGGKLDGGKSKTLGGMDWRIYLP